jgi:hypothetical protein
VYSKARLTLLIQARLRARKLTIHIRGLSACDSTQHRPERFLSFQKRDRDSICSTASSQNYEVEHTARDPGSKQRLLRPSPSTGKAQAKRKDKQTHANVLHSTNAVIPGSFASTSISTFQRRPPIQTRLSLQGNVAFFFNSDRTSVNVSTRKLGQFTCKRKYFFACNASERAIEVLQTLKGLWKSECTRRHRRKATCSNLITKSCDRARRQHGHNFDTYCTSACKCQMNKSLEHHIKHKKQFVRIEVTQYDCASKCVVFKKVNVLLACWYTDHQHAPITSFSRWTEWK